MQQKKIQADQPRGAVERFGGRIRWSGAMAGREGGRGVVRAGHQGEGAHADLVEVGAAPRARSPQGEGGRTAGRGQWIRGQLPRGSSSGPLPCGFRGIERLGGRESERQQHPPPFLREKKIRLGIQERRFWGAWVSLSIFIGVHTRISLQPTIATNSTVHIGLV